MTFFRSTIHWLILITGALAFCILILSAEKREPFIFPDTLDYKIQSEYSLLSGKFYAPTPDLFFAPRPFTVPLFYKLSKAEPQNMITLQRILHCAGALLFVMGFLLHIRSRVVQVIAGLVLLFFFTWWNIVGWTDTLLSESISMSLLFTWLASILFYYKKPGWKSLAGLGVITVLFSFTRDSWPYVILLFAALNLFYDGFSERNRWHQNAVFLVFCCLLFGFQSYTSNKGERYKLPVFNSIAGRISHQPAYMEWFTKQGMPYGDKLVTKFGKLDIDADSGRAEIYKTYTDPNYMPLFDWITSKGKGSYMRFVLSHPSYLLMRDVEARKRAAFGSHGLRHYTHPAKNLFANAGNVFPLFNGYCLLVLLLACLVLLFRQGTQKILLVPVMLAALLGVNALLLFNADALEVERHVFITQILLELCCLMALTLLADRLIPLLRSRFRKTH